MEKVKEYQFPPQLGQTHIYFGYTGWEWVVIALGSVVSLYAFLATINVLVILPVIMFSLLCCKPTGNTCMMSVLLRSYNYFVAKPMTYDYKEE